MSWNNNCAPKKLKTLKALAAIALAVYAPVNVPAQAATSANYELNYGSVTNSGAMADTGDYLVQSRVRLNGLQVTTSSSNDYVFEPAVMGASTNPASVSFWSLY